MGVWSRSQPKRFWGLPRHPTQKPSNPSIAARLMGSSTCMVLHLADMVMVHMGALQRMIWVVMRE